jgi:lysophospholipase L1-like esterase
VVSGKFRHIFNHPVIILCMTVFPPSFHRFRAVWPVAFAILLLMSLAGCRKEGGVAPPQRVSGSGGVPTPRTWLALGDSYTIGQGIVEGERFPHQAAMLLQERNLALDTLKYIAMTGWTTYDLDQALKAFRPQRHTVVTLLIGVNDQYTRIDTSTYRDRFADLLDRSIELTGGLPRRVFVLSIPDYGVTPWAKRMDTSRVRREIDAFNAINRRITLTRGCPYIDITPLTREGAFNRNLICGDSLHPSGIEYRRWADRIVPLMEGEL